MGLWATSYLQVCPARPNREHSVKADGDQGKTLYTPYLPPPPPKASAAEVSASSTATTSAGSEARPKAEMKMLRLYSTEDLHRCPLDKWGILDPGTHRREPGREAELREDGTWIVTVSVSHSTGSPEVGCTGGGLTKADLSVLSEGVPPVDLILLPGVAFDTKSNRVSLFEDQHHTGSQTDRCSWAEARRTTTTFCTSTPRPGRLLC